ncbi:hypothetical protein SAMD00023378_3913 [Ralstonia sp. NT80]|uniref:hypothetical protein n=1 Tax=Ralstonia sp. NT80 TaxID=1218247 RepID=UPI00073E9137|nr:hypothetical protein [Ralstonia sp. NT80]GAQ30230.1 hypothetical protein SAMD00023378_3913 [Ralstonia sp. NT80]
MAMEMKLSARVTTAWWLPFYLRSVAAFSAMTGMRPNMAKVEATVYRAIRVHIVSEPLPA